MLMIQQYIYITGKNVALLFDQMNEDLGSLSNWFKANELSLNLKKTNYILFCKKYIAHNYKLSLDNTYIDEVKSVKFLGIYIDSCMNWKRIQNM